MFEKYQHVARLGSSGVRGIMDGKCYVFPKLDGTNASVWHEDHVMHAGSRQRELSIASDDRDFFKQMLINNPINNLLEANPTWRLYGEWLVPHALKTYRLEAWNKFYVFDVMDKHGYIPYDLYKLVLDSFGVDYIPCLSEVTRGSVALFQEIAEKNTYLMQEGHVGEGIVIKRYNFVNRYGRITWAKLVRSEFKDKHVKEMGPQKIEGSYTAEHRIVDMFVTTTLVHKELAKINQPDPQARLLSTIWHCILTEELAGAVKKLRNPVIDFGVLRGLVTSKVKQLVPELF